MADPIPTDVLEALHWGEAPKQVLSAALAEKVLRLMATGGLPWPQTERQWRWSMDDDDACLVFFAAKHGLLPSNFDQWAWKDSYGWTVAHKAAKHGALPPSFDQWALWGPDLFTVAHAQAWVGYPFPSGFDQWHLMDARGRVVAHFAAQRDILPSNFDQWLLTDGEGRTVADVALKHGTIDQARYDQIMLEHERLDLSKKSASLTVVSRMIG